MNLLFLLCDHFHSIVIKLGMPMALIRQIQTLRKLKHIILMTLIVFRHFFFYWFFFFKYKFFHLLLNCSFFSIHFSILARSHSIQFQVTFQHQYNNRTSRHHHHHLCFLRLVFCIVFFFFCYRFDRNK